MQVGSGCVLVSVSNGHTTTTSVPEAMSTNLLHVKHIRDGNKS